MGLERASVSTKLPREDEEFIYEWAKHLKPHEVSQSSLTGLCVRIVRILRNRGQLNLEPKALQAFLENGTDAKDVTDLADRWNVAQAKKALKR